MLLLCSALVLAAPPPEVTLSWRGPRADLTLVAPPGEHLNPDAPAAIRLIFPDREVRVMGSGAVAAEGVALGEVRGQRIVAGLSIPLCTDAGSQCRVAELTATGEAGVNRRGATALLTREGLPARDPWELAGPLLSLSGAHPEATWIPLTAASVLVEGGLNEDALYLVQDQLGASCGAAREDLRTAGIQLLEPTGEAARLADDPPASPCAP
ncbi:MAG: hypothetical protein JXX28_03395 [Deltaproteobacteria bacterium]|nr:hypothetical protein [Deltaproteobacteria bacterium]